MLKKQHINHGVLLEYFSVCNYQRMTCLLYSCYRYKGMAIGRTYHLFCGDGIYQDYILEVESDEPPLPSICNACLTNLQMDCL